ncbi:MAG: aryl-sulfate sulfotransferase [Ignavibacteriae bacterium]|nr:aryl-sulfate sulfotransferase [Ignavibacteriota bacterium]
MEVTRYLIRNALIRWDVIALSSILLLSAACERTPLQPVSEDLIPEIHAAQLWDNPNNVLSALMSVRTSNAQLASVEILDDSLWESTTPFLTVTNDSCVIPVLELLAQKTYTLRVVAISSTGIRALGPTITYTTRALLTDIPSLRVTFSQSPSVQYVLMGLNSPSAGKSYAVIVNKSGTIVWYKEFSGSVFDFQKHFDGSYTSWSSAGPNSPFQKLDILGNVIELYYASNGLQTGLHEFRVVGSDYALFGVEYRTMDLSMLGGLSNAQVRGLVVEYHRSGQATFFWNTFDHFSVTDAAPDIPLTTASVNPWHGNAIDMDSEGNLIVSFRNSDEIAKIDSRTGSIIWRLGGENNEFSFLNDPLNGFSHQHGVRRLFNGNILMFDNGNLHIPQESRAVEFRIDEATKTAEMVWEYRADPPLFANLQGSVQRLSNGNTLICFGTAQRIVEVDAIGTKLWELAIEEPGRNCYRAFSVSSLY